MSKTNINEVEINGKVYVLKGSEPTDYSDDLSDDYVIVRTYSAGVHAGYLSKRDGKEVTLTNSRRIWYWSGAASLSQMAVEGVSKPQECKFSVPVPLIQLTEAIEIIACTKRAVRNIRGVPEWRAQHES